MITSSLEVFLFLSVGEQAAKGNEFANAYLRRRNGSPLGAAHCVVLAPLGELGNEGGSMSEMKGNKARFGRTRKEDIRRRKGVRELRKTLEGKTSGTGVDRSKQEENSVVSLTAVAIGRGQ